MAQQPVLRPWAQYLFGLLMVVQRAAGGNTTYFMGEVSAAGWWYYFPVIYLLKEPLATHILTIIALFYACLLLFKSAGWKSPLKKFFSWVNRHLTEFAMLAFIVLYWATSIKSPLNIGVRHVLPTFPFVYLLVGNQLIKWLKIKFPQNLANLWQFTKQISVISINTIIKYGLVLLLIAWQFVTVLLIYPHFIAYFNELAGGPKDGYRYAVDSNLDWGQDLKRLTKWTEKNNIDKIYVDYFGGAVAEYYLADKFLPWHGSRTASEMTESNYLAVSATFLQGGRGEPVPGFTDNIGYYRWLDAYEPVIAIGHSIFVYKID